MLEYMMTAEVGDDVFGEDPSVNRLESYTARLFGKEDSVFCPSGTMTNQIAIKVNTQPLDELICDHFSHVYQYEAGGYAFNSGVSINLIHGTNGKITVDQVKQAIKPEFDWLPRSRLVVLENSCNKGGGSFYTLDEIRPIRNLCLENELRVHLDGARLFNVLVETGESPEDVGQMFDSISICISKGLGAPVGSLLIGNEKDIQKARRFRKVMGGGMRQAGYLAAACQFALENNIRDLKIDNARAAEIGRLLEKCSWVEEVRPVQTNIVIFRLKSDLKASDFVPKLMAQGIKSSAFGDREVRFVFHRDITDSDMDRLREILLKLRLDQIDT